MKFLLRVNLLMCLLVCSGPALAVRVSYIGPEKILEDVILENGSADKPVEQGKEDILFEKAEPKVIGTREVVKGVCANKKPFLVYQVGNSWQSENPEKRASKDGETGLDLAISICGEKSATIEPYKAKKKTEDEETLQYVRTQEPSQSLVRKKIQYTGECTTFKDAALECMVKTVELIRRNKGN